MVSVPPCSETISKKLAGGGHLPLYLGHMERGEIFFWPPKKIKPSVQKVPLYAIYGDNHHLKLICTHQAHQNPPKTNIIEVKKWTIKGNLEEMSSLSKLNH